MNKEKLEIEEQKAYEIEKEKGLIYDLNGSVGFKVGWEAAVKLLNIDGVIDCSTCKHREVSKYVTPCYSCRDNDGYDNFVKLQKMTLTTGIVFIIVFFIAGILIGMNIAVRIEIGKKNRIINKSEKGESTETYKIDW